MIVAMTIIMFSLGGITAVCCVAILGGVLWGVLFVGSFLLSRRFSVV